MLKLVLSFLFVVCVNLFLTIPALAQSRIALVIGNSSYKSAPLLNPINDAALMTRALEETGFTVTTIIDANQKTMKRALIEFGRKLRKSDAVGLFYYAGHGVQVKGENYLIPLGINIQDEAEVEIEAINVNSFLGTMERSSNSINIVILDACRNNPFNRSFRSATSGLAEVSAPQGSYIAYATAPGQVAYDGDLANSPYTMALTKAMTTPNLTIEQVFKRARREVLLKTKDRQTPWENSSIIGDFYFKRSLQLAQTNAQSTYAPPALVIDDTTIELAFWDTNKEENHRSLFKSYLEAYPKEKFSVDAIKKAKERTFKAQISKPQTRVPLSNNTEQVALTRMLQTELERVGCNPGIIDGKWGPNGKSALKKFNYFARKNLEVSDVSEDAYFTIKRKHSRVCPPRCDAQSALIGGRCVSHMDQAKMRSLSISKAHLKCGIFNGNRFCQ